MERTLETRDHAETQALARELARYLEPGDVLALVGDLGAGKTTFVQGLAEGLGVPDDEPVVSPTFTIVNEHRGRLPLYHIDLYRLETLEDLLEIGLDEYLSGNGVSAVEWFDKFPEAWPEETVEIRIEFAPRRPQGRSIVVRTAAPRVWQRLERWVSRF